MRLWSHVSQTAESVAKYNRWAHPSGCCEWGAEQSENGECGFKNSRKNNREMFGRGRRNNQIKSDRSNNAAICVQKNLQFSHLTRKS